jgi:NADH dehydrogenase (ubiquinone) 1 alpha subcomplex subunit 6
MYNLPMPVSTIRTRIRQEFEKHRYANQLPVVDILLFKSNADYQVDGNHVGLSPLVRPAC